MDDPGIGKWQTALSEKWDSLSPDEQTRYGVIAEQWKERGPPPEVQRRLVFSLQNLRVSTLISKQRSQRKDREVCYGVSETD